MDEMQFSQLASAIRTYYPKEKILPNKQAMSLWYEMLKDIPYDQAVDALKKWVATNHWSPAISDIRSMVVQSVETEADHEWSDAWEEVERAIRKHGYYREQAALNSMSPITRKCVEAIGWKNICLSEEVGVERGHFRSMYESKSRSVRKSRQIQPGLRTSSENRMLTNLLGNVAKELVADSRLNVEG